MGSLATASCAAVFWFSVNGLMRLPMITPGLAFISTSDASRTSTAASRPSARRAPAPVGSLLPESVDGGT